MSDDVFNNGALICLFILAFVIVAMPRNDD